MHDFLFWFLTTVMPSAIGSAIVVWCTRGYRERLVAQGLLQAIIDIQALRQACWSKDMPWAYQAGLIYQASVFEAYAKIARSKDVKYWLEVFPHLREPLEAIHARAAGVNQ